MPCAKSQSASAIWAATPKSPMCPGTNVVRPSQANGRPPWRSPDNRKWRTLSPPVWCLSEPSIVNTCTERSGQGVCEPRRRRTYCYVRVCMDTFILIYALCITLNFREAGSHSEYFHTLCVYDVIMLFIRNGSRPEGFTGVSGSEHLTQWSS